MLWGCKTRPFRVKWGEELLSIYTHTVFWFGVPLLGWPSCDPRRKAEIQIFRCFGLCVGFCLGLGFFLFVCLGLFGLVRLFVLTSSGNKVSKCCSSPTRGQVLFCLVRLGCNKAHLRAVFLPCCIVSRRQLLVLSVICRFKEQECKCLGCDDYVSSVLCWTGWQFWTKLQTFFYSLGRSWLLVV